MEVSPRSSSKNAWSVVVSAARAVSPAERVLSELSDEVVDGDRSLAVRARPRTLSPPVRSSIAQ